MDERIVLDEVTKTEIVVRAIAIKLGNAQDIFVAEPNKANIIDKILSCLLRINVRLNYIDKQVSRLNKEE